MNTFYKVTGLILLASFFLVACEPTERSKAAGETIKGTAQEAAGDMTNDNDLKTKGKTNRTKGDLRNTKEDVKDLITGD